MRHARLAHPAAGAAGQLGEPGAGSGPPLLQGSRLFLPRSALCISGAMPLPGPPFLPGVRLDGPGAGCGTLATALGVQGETRLKTRLHGHRPWDLGLTGGEPQAHL